MLQISSVDGGSIPAKPTNWRISPHSGQIQKVLLQCTIMGIAEALFSPSDRILLT